MSLFDAALAQGRPALVGYLPAGFPTVAGGIEAITAAIDAGVDVFEIGLPYSDPVMDGPVIQRATETALARGVRTRDVLATVEAVSGLGVPVLVMTYWNPVDRYGVDAFARDLAAAGGAGLITPDLIPDEAEEWLAASDEHKLDRVFLVSPSSTDDRSARCIGSRYDAARTPSTNAIRRARRDRSHIDGPAMKRATAVETITRTSNVPVEPFMSASPMRAPYPERPDVSDGARMIRAPPLQTASTTRTAGRNTGAAPHRAGAVRTGPRRS